MKKGDKVRVKAELKSDYTNFYAYQGYRLFYSPKEKTNVLIKKIYRRECNFEGLVIGHSYLATGEFRRGNADPENYEPNYLFEDKRHKVWLVEPLTSQRYFKPMACFEEDLEVINCFNQPSLDDEFAPWDPSWNDDPGYF